MINHFKNDSLLDSEININDFLKDYIKFLDEHIYLSKMTLDNFIIKKLEKNINNDNFLIKDISSLNASRKNRLIDLN